MATVSQNQPFNARKAPKSRNGCSRCKQKRLKCDERKPECLQCNRKGLPCPGYKTKPLVWSTKHEKLLVREHDASSTEKVEKRPHPRTAATADQAITHPQADSPSTAAVLPVAQLIAFERPNTITTDSLVAIRQQLQRSEVPDFLLHLPTMLVEYYFSYVCQIFSSFDGTLNPFRSTVGRLWDGSAPIYFAIQSMAAAYLANHLPRMTAVGIQMQRETYRSLYQGMTASEENLDRTLLTVLLVGQTTAWHNPKDLGLDHLTTAKRLHRRRLEQQSSELDSKEKRQNQFFEQCIMYWDMLAAFVKDDVDGLIFDDTAELSHLGHDELGDMSSRSDETPGQIFPHPWTGVAPKIQRLFAQVGRLIRSYRKAMAQEIASLDFLSIDPISSPTTSGVGAIDVAESLEEQLLAVKLPALCSLVDAGDENTPADHYIHFAEAYRYAGLLELYRVFPSILLKRIPPGGFPSQDLFPFLELCPSLQIGEVLVSFALHTVSLLEKLPSTSGTRCLQPIIFIAAGSELRFENIPDPLSPFASPSTSTFNSITNREIDIASARRFVTTRLQDFCTSLPAKPIKNALMLVEETWTRLDAGQETFWIDVMQDLGLETIYG